MAENLQATASENPLETQPIGKLIFKYSIPAVITGIINAVYNIIDQIFIGNSYIGADGNGATGISFPVTMIITTIAMLFGTGAASAFSLYLGAKENAKAKSVIGNALTLIFISGIILTIVGLCATRPILYAFGGRNTVDDYGVAHNTLDLAVEYSRIIFAACILPIIITGAGQFVRADGSPRYSMIVTVTGALINCGLDPLFIYVFKWGMTGAALATIIGQFVSAVCIIAYMFRFKSVKLAWRDLLLKARSVGRIFQLGLAAGATQLAVTIVNIALNNVLGKYGEQSIYGRANVINAVAVIGKINALFTAIVFGISQSIQPILGYNIGNGKYKRAKRTVYIVGLVVIIVSTVALLLFELIPRQLTGIFGSSTDELYYQFAERYFRIYFCGTIFSCMQIMGANFFPAIGKGLIGIIVALSRQLILLLPLIIVLPFINGWGLNGVLWSAPIADLLSGLISVSFMLAVIRKWKENKE